ncbi:MAG: hypothetical protein M0Z55_10905 [Peptococcaceae bacterium]|nr:hypothetical protein [Peptococcaceae bacterium]
MDEHVGKIKPIAPICPVRKLALARPKRGRRELMYQLKRYFKAENAKTRNQIKTKQIRNKEIPKMGKNSATDQPENLTNLPEDLAKRAIYDRTMLLGD